MARHKYKLNNGGSGLGWVNRPSSKMNNSELRDLGKNLKKFAKRYTSKKRRVFLKNDNVA